jgi:hypothetical protein
MGFNADAYPAEPEGPADYTETLSAGIPLPFLPIFDAIALKDYDAPFKRCGAGLRFLSENGFVEQNRGQKMPVRMTELGKALATERGIAPGI